MPVDEKHKEAHLPAQDRVALESLHLILDEMDAIVYVADMQTYEVLYANRLCRETFGDDVVGRLCWQTLQTGQDGPCAFCTNPKLVDERGEPTGATCWTTRNTKVGRVLAVRDKAVRWHDGRVVRLEIATDVTAASETEQALKRSEQRYRSIFEEAVEGIYRVTFDGRFLDINPAMARIFGYAEPREMMDAVQDVGAHFYHDPSRRRRFLDDLEQDGELTDYAIQYRDKHGAPRWCSESARIVRDAEGTPTHIEGTIFDITERVLAQQRLEEREERYKALSQAAFEGVVMSEKGIVLDANRAACDMFGYAVEELQGKPLVGLVSSSGRDRLRGKILSDNQEAFEVACLRRSGESFPAEVRSRMVPYREGFARLTVVRDISARKEAEAAMRLSEQRYRRIVETANEGIWMLDAGDRTSYANRRMAEMLGLDAGEMVGRHLHEFLPPEDIPRAEKRLEERMHGRDGKFEQRFLREDGREFWALVSATSMQDDEGRFTGSFGMLTDITDQRRAQQARAESERMFEGVFENAPVGVSIALGDGQILRGNPALGDMLGYSAQELSGMNFYDLTHPEDRDLVDQWMRTVTTGLHSVAFEKRYVRKDGSVFEANIFTSPILDDDGRFRLLIGIIVDVSERKRVEEAMRRACTEAERASRFKGQFLANMSHELRTPLNGIFGMLQLLADTRLDREQAEYVDTGLATGRTLMRIINDILDFSKIDAGVLELAREEFSLRESVGMVLDNFRVAAAEAGITLQGHIPDDIPDPLVGDGAKVRQVLFNLVGNAVKFCPRGGVEVAVQAAAPAGGEELRLLFCVRDTGIGIPDGEMDAVFEAFTQVDGESTRRYSGTGLGLGIVRGLVRRMGGTINVDSTEGVGTEVFVALPFELGSALAAEDERAEAEAPIGSLRILLAEDEAVNRMAARVFLEKRGHTVLCAGNGNEALAVLAQERMDCVFMDIQMPGMNGIDATRAIREARNLATPPDVPIIAMTAHAMKGEREKFLAVGMDDYIAKPVDMVELDRVLRDVEQAGKETDDDAT